MNEVVICLSPEGEDLIDLKKLMEKTSLEVESRKALSFPPHITLVHRIHTKKNQRIQSRNNSESQRFKKFQNFLWKNIFF